MRLTFPVAIAGTVGAAPAAPLSAVPPQRILIVDDDPWSSNHCAMRWSPTVTA